MVGFRTGLDFAFPHHDGRDADAAFVQEAFAPTIFGLEPAAAVEPRESLPPLKVGPLSEVKIIKVLSYRFSAFNFWI